MTLPIAAAILGLVVSLFYLVNAARVLKTPGRGHTHNAAMIHTVMAGLLLPACLIIIVSSLL